MNISQNMEAAVQAIEKFPEIALWELKIISRLLNRDCDDDVSDLLSAALDAVSSAIHKIENREYTPSQQTYMREQEAR